MVEHFKYGNITETGSATDINEDYYGCFDTPNGKIFVLCDGEGDPIGGHIASKIAVEAIREYYNLIVYPNLIISLRDALIHANNAVLRKIQTEPELAGMVTTCLIVIIKDNRVFYASIGNSRLYHFHLGKCKLISGGAGIKNFSTDTADLKENILGSNAVIISQICNEPLVPAGDDFLLLCSAGLSDILVQDFSLPIIYKNQELQMRVADLAKMVDKNQTADNTTLQLIEFEGDKSETAPISFNSSETALIEHVSEKTDKSPVILPIILVLMIAAVIYLGPKYFQKEETAVMVTSQTSSGVAPVIEKEIRADNSEDNLITESQSAAVTDTAKYTPHGFHPQLPPVNSGMSFESGSPETVRMPMQQPGRILSGSEEAYTYTLQKGDNELALKNKFGKTWEQLKNENADYSEALPQAGKEIKIYGYLYFASGSDRERNENIENVLKSTPGLKRSQIIIVPDGILIP